MTPLRIAIVVPGRLHAFELAAALQKQGHVVFVYSNCRVSEAMRFNLNLETYRCNVLNRVMMRLWLNILGSRFQSMRDRIICNWLDRWALRKIKNDLPFDVIHAFSGVSLHVLHYAKANAIFTQLLRGSSHIEVQKRLLVSEAKRSACAVDMPSDWMIQRELDEYAIANRIIVLSSFAMNSFNEAYSDAPLNKKITKMLLGTDLSQFKADDATREKRLNYVRSGMKLRVLKVGSFNARKGAADFVKVAAALSEEMDFTFVGDMDPHWASICRNIAPKVKLVNRVPQKELVNYYAQHDIFYFPTIEDGYAVVLSQALAAGLCVIASENSAAPDLLADGKTGFVIPIQQQNYSIKILRELDNERERLAQIIDATASAEKSRSWDDVAKEFAEYVHQHKGI